MNARLVRLEHQVAHLQQALYGSKRERVSSGQLQLALMQLPAPDSHAPLQAELLTEPPQPKARPKQTRTPRHIPATIPRQTILSEPPPASKWCADCQCDKKYMGSEYAEVLEFKPGEFFVERTDRRKYACPKCKCGVVIGPGPHRVLDQAMPGPGLVAEIVVRKYADHCPLEVDDTPVRVLDREHEKGIKRGHLWSLVSDEEVVYFYTPNWQGEPLVQRLKDFDGVLQSDGYSDLNKLYARSQRPPKRAGCWAHARRKMVRALEAGDARAAVPLALIRKLYKIEAQAPQEGMDSAARLLLRQSQSAPVMVQLEQAQGDFLGFSYGARPGRGAHGALDALSTGIWRKKVSFVLDTDIRGFYEAIDHGWMMKLVEHRIADKRVLRLIQKWVSAGVMENGTWTESEEGTPQGATISSLLSNIYLHYVLDLWVQQWRNRTARGDVIITRYVDDFIVGFQHQADADRFLRELRERRKQFSLELHPDKTRLIEFGRFAVRDRGRAGRGAPETFNFLGFVHVCRTSREGGFWVQRRTIQKRMTARLHELKSELQRRRHQPFPEQGRWLQQVVRGYFGYHGVPGNEKRLRAFRDQLKRLWLRALRRRSQRDKMSWKRMGRLEDRWLPPAQRCHPWPQQRFDARIQGKNRMR